MGIHYSHPEGSALKGRRSTRDPLSPENLGKAEPSQDIVFTYADLLRLLKPPSRSRTTRDYRLRSIKQERGIRPYDWYTWRGYKVDDAAQLLYDIAEKDNFKRVDPVGAVGKLYMAFHDLNNSIPSAVAARVLGLEIPEFKVNGKYHDGEPLPFETHPRQAFYPWMKRPVAKRSVIKELLESGEYPGVISYDGEVDRPGP